MKFDIFYFMPLRFDHPGQNSKIDSAAVTALEVYFPFEPFLNPFDVGQVEEQEPLFRATVLTKIKVRNLQKK